MLTKDRAVGKTASWPNLQIEACCVFAAERCLVTDTEISCLCRRLGGELISVPKPSELFYFCEY